MALLQRQPDYRIRPVNKEPEWSSLCNDVFDQYLDDDDLFGLDTNQRDRSSSDDSVNLFDFSGASEQSHQTDATSPMPSWESAFHERTIEARQPKAKEPVNFWTKTLQALEKNAAECELKQQKLRSTKSHPDFLSLGGCPSPPVVPSSPTDQSFSAQRRVSRSTANGKRRNITARSVSRGRPSGISKTTVAGSADPYATLRKCSASPPKMMTPSRYRGSFKDVWAEKLQSSPGKYELRPPAFALPASPPPSARGLYEDDIAAFGSPSIYPPVPQFDDQISPLTNTFRLAHIHDPGLPPPALNAAAHASNSYITSVPPVPRFVAHGLPPTDAAPFYPEGTSSLAANKIEDFDFGFATQPPAEAWTAGPVHDTIAGDYVHNLISHEALSPVDPGVVRSIETADMGQAGLGISCNPSLTSFNPRSLHSTVQVPLNAPDYTSHPRTPHSQRVGRTLHRRAKSSHRSPSPSPPATEPRSSKRASSSRRTSRQRRAKSTTATPREVPGRDQSGFVNFTAQDSTKILSGVAPSGSSKTKARREKEAAEKRRRLSQAAVRAVVEAGGDLDALQEAGLLLRHESADAVDEEEESLFVTP